MDYITLFSPIIIAILFIIALSIVIWVILKHKKDNAEPYREYAQKFVAGVAGGFALWSATKMFEYSNLGFWDNVILDLALAVGIFAIFAIGLLVTTHLKSS